MPTLFLFHSFQSLSYFLAASFRPRLSSCHHFYLSRDTPNRDDLPYCIYDNFLFDFQTLLVRLRLLAQTQFLYLSVYVASVSVPSQTSSDDSIVAALLLSSSDMMISPYLGSSNDHHVSPSVIFRNDHCRHF